MFSDICVCKGGVLVVCLMVYIMFMVKLVDWVCDLVLVGDSVGMVLYGLFLIFGVMMEMMVLYGCVVVWGVDYVCLVVDMFFGSYEESLQQVMCNVVWLLVEIGCQVVKLEGGWYMVEIVVFLVMCGILVMGYVGLMLQVVNVFGGYKVQGCGVDGDRIVDDVVVLVEVGVFVVVLEKLFEVLGMWISCQIVVLIIGIGVGVGCDGQVFVVDDMLGIFSDFKLKFVK